MHVVSSSPGVRVSFLPLIGWMGADDEAADGEVDDEAKVSRCGCCPCERGAVKMRAVKHAAIHRSSELHPAVWSISILSTLSTSASISLAAAALFGGMLKQNSRCFAWLGAPCT
jgi:hypothetical protein